MRTGATTLVSEEDFAVLDRGSSKLLNPNGSKYQNQQYSGVVYGELLIWIRGRQGAVYVAKPLGPRDEP